MQLQASECKNTDYATSCIIMQTAPSLIYRTPIAMISLRGAFNLKDIFQILIPTLVRLAMFGRQVRFLCEQKSSDVARLARTGLDFNFKDCFLY